MFYVSVLATVFLLLLFFCLFISIVGNGRRETKGGPVLRSRKRRGIIRFPKTPGDSQENYIGILR